jgi:hypothetical protein
LRDARRGVSLSKMASRLVMSRKKANQISWQSGKFATQSDFS